MADGQRDVSFDEPVPLVADAVAERLRTLEAQLAALQARLSQMPPAGPLPEGYAAPRAAGGLGGLFGAAAGLLPGFAAGGAGFWTRFALLREVRLTVGMYVDSRYRVSRLTQLAVPGLLALMVANYFFFNWLMIGIYVVTPLLERSVLVLLALVLAKVLSREAARYADVLAYLNRFGR